MIYVAEYEHGAERVSRRRAKHILQRSRITDIRVGKALISRDCGRSLNRLGWCYVVVWPTPNGYNVTRVYGAGRALRLAERHG